jgi:cation diffusion facilitator CzcD-associated flavoprotein CzcO
MAGERVTALYDAIIVGAGFSGLRALHEVRRLGMSVKVIEAGSDVGSTWYWNRYPGARTDSESWVYCYDFDEELLQDYDHAERFPTQPQSLRYLQHVADRYDMRRDIQFDTRVSGAEFDESTDTWTLRTGAGEEFTCRWYLAASGLLNVRAELVFPGVDTFKGQWLETARWPHEGVDLTGKRVAVIGTGATAIQVDYLGALLEHAQHRGITRIEARSEVASEWAAQCENLQGATLLEGGRAERSWFLGANIPGKRNKTMFYFGGVNAYNQILRESIDGGFPGYEFAGERVAA